MLTLDRLQLSGGGGAAGVRQQLQPAQKLFQPLLRPFRDILFRPVPRVDVGAILPLLLTRTNLLLQSSGGVATAIFRSLCTLIHTAGFPTVKTCMIRSDLLMRCAHAHWRTSTSMRVASSLTLTIQRESPSPIFAISQTGPRCHRAQADVEPSKVLSRLSSKCQENADAQQGLRRQSQSQPKLATDECACLTFVQSHSMPRRELQSLLFAEPPLQQK